MLDQHLYNGYLLSCHPRTIDDGRYQARLGITAFAGDKTRGQRFLDLEVFTTENEAAAHAKAVGMQWVDDNANGASTTTALGSVRLPRTPRQATNDEVPLALNRRRDSSR